MMNQIQAVSCQEKGGGGKKALLPCTGSNTASSRATALSRQFLPKRVYNLGYDKIRVVNSRKNFTDNLHTFFTDIQTFLLIQFT